MQHTHFLLLLKVLAHVKAIQPNTLSTWKVSRSVELAIEENGVEEASGFATPSVRAGGSDGGSNSRDNLIPSELYRRLETESIETRTSPIPAAGSSEDASALSTHDGVVSSVTGQGDSDGWLNTSNQFGLAVEENDAKEEYDCWGRQRQRGRHESASVSPNKTSVFGAGEADGSNSGHNPITPDADHRYIETRTSPIFAASLLTTTTWNSLICYEEHSDASNEETGNDTVIENRGTNEIPPNRSVISVASASDGENEWLCSCSNGKSCRYCRTI